MDGEDGLSQKAEEASQGKNRSKENDKKAEAKGTCLKIEGKDDYVFKSYRITPHEILQAESPSCHSETMAKESSLASLSFEGTEEDESSEVERLSTEETAMESCEKDGQMSPAISNKSPSTEMNSSELKTNIKAEPNDMGELAQDDEKLSFDGPFGPFATRGYDDDYGSLFSGYSSTLYDVAMDAVTQSLLSSIRSPLNPRKKSPAWNHFFISPRDSTKAICMYCMKEFSRGKNEKDLSTSCLMRHVRRAHPAVLLQDGDALNNLSNTSSSLTNGDSLDNPNPLSSLLSETTEMVSKDSLPKVKPKAEKSVKGENSAVSSPHSLYSHNDDTSDLSTESPGSALKSANSRRRSAVWKHFYLSPADSSKAVCIHCMNEFSRGKNGKDLGTSCLIRHMWRAHRDIVIEENGQGSSIPPPYTTPPTLLSRTLVQDEIKTEQISSMCPAENISVEMPDHEDRNHAYQPEPESSLDSSLRLKEERLPRSCSPEEHTERQSLSQEPSSIFQQNKKIMKRVKSEVWHHFIVSPVDQLKALCRYCPCVISRGKRGDFGTSCLMRHLMRRHPDVLKTPNRTMDKLSLPQSPQAAHVAEGDMLNASDVTAAENKSHALPVFSKKTSKLWNHFSISSTDPTKVVCLHCSRTISRGKKTTNLGTSCLFRHMQRFHGHVLENNRAISGDVSSAEIKQELMDISLYEESAEKFSECHPIAKKITKLIAEMLALDLQPSTVVENVGLSRLLEYLQPQYSLPSSSYFTSTAVPEMCESVKDVVLTHLKEAEGGIIHFTTSVWMSSQTQEYLILTAHWVTFESQVLPQGQDFHCSALLGVSSIDCDYNMMNVQKQLEYLWDTWIGSSGLKIGYTVTDNQTIEGILESNHKTILHCFGHNIDVIVNEAIKSQRMVQNLLSIARKVCERVHRSAKAKEKLAELQKAYQLPENQLVQDVPSKWKTSYFMLERLVEQKKAIDEMSIECNFRELISCDQWEVMQSVCNALKPFEVACREMSNRSATLGQVIPLIHILNRKIDMLFDETMGIDNMLKSLKDAMVSRMSPTLHDPKYVWATMLDPRYKTSLFTEEEAERYKQDLINELEVSTSAETKQPITNGCGKIPASPNKENLWALMDDVRLKIKQEERPKSLELAVLEYLEEDILDQSCDPLDYWNLKKLLWPDLAKVAVRYVGCPPSIVPADTLFSTSSVNCALNQSRPLLENLEGLLFLKVNLPLVYFQY